MVRNCHRCDEVRASFQVRPEILKPSPISGFLYRWGCDLFGPLTSSEYGNVYVMVCIEYWSKFVEVIPIPTKAALRTRLGFLQHILNRYSAPAQVTTDQGSEWEGEFAALMQEALIDHNTTSPNHPQADGLVERAIQSIKKCLKKSCTDTKDWEERLAWLVLGYNCSIQSSTKYSPYELMYGRKPVVPPAKRARLEGPVDYSNPEKAAKELAERAEVLKDNCVMAGNNLLIAQHRDSQRRLSTSH